MNDEQHGSGPQGPTDTTQGPTTTEAPAPAPQAAPPPVGSPFPTGFQPPPGSPFPQGPYPPGGYQPGGYQPAPYDPGHGYYKSPSGPNAGSIVGIVFACLGIVLALVRCSLRMERNRDYSFESSYSSYSPSYSSPYIGGSYSSTKRLELPGMTVTAPGAPAVTGDYVTGSVQSTYPDFAISWQRGSLPSASEIRSLLEGIATALEAQLATTASVGTTRTVTLGGRTAYQVDISTGMGPLHITLGECGGRIVQIMTGGVGVGSSYMDTMVSSFTCTPDPSKDVSVTSVVVDVRKGWGRMAATDRLTLANKHDVLVQPTSMAGDATTPLEKFIPDAVRAAGMHVGATAKRRGDKRVWTGTMTVDGETYPAALVAWQCPNRIIGAVYVMSMGKAKLDEGLALAYTGRCLEDGEAQPDYPAYEP